MRTNSARAWVLSRLPLPVLGFAALVVASTWSSDWMGDTAAAQGRGAGQGRGVAPGRDPARELAMKIDAPFTLAAVGDIFGAMAPIVPLQEPRLQSLLKIIRDADVGFANAESSIADLPRFTGPFGGLLAPKAAAADMKAMGIRIVNRANNHTGDNGDEGMFETNALLDDVGIVHAGTGRNLEEARDAAYLMTSKGRVGLVGLMPISENAPGGNQGFSFNRTAATSRSGNMGGKPGLNPLRLTTYNIVTAEEFQALKKIRDAVMARRGEVSVPLEIARERSVDRLELFGKNYKIGPKTGDWSYEMNAGDLRENLRSIRNGKFFADFMMVSVHAHQNSFAFQQYSFDNSTPDFMVEFAHAAIDNGADVFLGQGVHTIRGIEIYKGKPIFYGLSNFAFYMNTPIGAAAGGGEGELSRGERSQANLERPGGLSQPDNMEALLATSRFEGGKLVEVRIYPTDVGKGYRPVSKIGIPLVPTAEVAREILEKLQRLSKPFGTNLTIENGVGVIRVTSTQTAAGGSR
jgi:poly-gamma-glutamate capsule biosynthesis protein CapA/YwtB (metallophosphatase superfamily)